MSRHKFYRMRVTKLSLHCVLYVIASITHQGFSGCVNNSFKEEFLLKQETLDVERVLSPKVKTNTVSVNISQPVEFLQMKTFKSRETTIVTRYNCTCGVRPMGHVKIVGGYLSKENAWPWLVALVYVGNEAPMQFCGSSLINSQYLLTASHCVMNIKKEELDKVQAFVGTNVISNPNVTKYNISEIKMHPNFNRQNLENDIALIKLSKPVSFSTQVLPVCLKQVGSSYVGVAGTVAGWGSIRKGGKGVDNLREVKVRVVSNSQCAKNYSVAKIRISGKMLCASFPTKDSCQGDSGGPFFMRIHNANVFTQVGIVSFGFDCGNPSFPGVYSRVASFVKWIRDNTIDAVYCKKSF